MCIARTVPAFGSGRTGLRNSRTLRISRSCCAPLAVVRLRRRLRLRLWKRIVQCRRGLPGFSTWICCRGRCRAWIGRRIIMYRLGGLRSILMRVRLGRCFRLRHGKGVAGGRIVLRRRFGSRLRRALWLRRLGLRGGTMAGRRLGGLLAALALPVRRRRVGRRTLATLLAQHVCAPQQQERTYHQWNNTEGLS